MLAIPKLKKSARIETEILANWRDSDRRIASRINVSRPLVSAVRRRLESEGKILIRTKSCHPVQAMPARGGNFSNSARTGERHFV
jgi:hypothetical protein